MKITINTDENVLEFEHGGWEASHTVYAEPYEAFNDQSIDGSAWEMPGDLTVAYASVSVGGTGAYCPDAHADALDTKATALRAEGYEVELD